MSNELLKKAYHRWRYDPNPPVPIEPIKEFLKLEGINLEKNEIRGDSNKK